MQSANVTLSDQDIDYIARVVDTEVPHHLAKSDPEEYNRMVAAVTDTLVNRMGSTAYPDSSTGVANQKNQFTAINGPKSYVDRNGRRVKTGAPGKVQKASKARTAVQSLVETHLKERDRGAPSAAGNDLNYANPGWSTANNSGWISAMAKQPGAQVLGRGDAIHIHGTDPNMLSSRTNTRVDVEDYESPNGYNPTAFSPEARPSMRDGAKYIAPPKPKSRVSALSAPITPVQRASLSPLINSAQQAINSRFPSQQQIAAARPSPVQQASTGPTSRPNNQPTQRSTDPWSIPAEIQNASARARQAFGIGGGQSQQRSTQPAPRPDYSSYGQRSSAENTRPSKTIAAYQQYGRSRSQAPEYITKTITQQVPRSKPGGGMTLDNVSDFAYGPSSMNVRQMNANAFGSTPPIPTAKPAQGFETITKEVQVKNPAYKALPPMPITGPMPLAKPQMAAPAQQKGFFGKLGGLFSPAGTAGGLIGGALGGPLGGLAGNLAGRGLSSVVQNNPTFGNRGATNSVSTGNNSGGPYAGQSWRNTSTGGVRTFNPSTRQYEDYGGSNAGNRSESQSTGSGGGCFITSAAVDVMGEKDKGDTLETLRWFRDNVMRKHPVWSKDVDTYYQIAPQIVSALDGDKGVYKQIYDKRLKPAVSAVKAGKYPEAYSIYKSMVGELIGAA